MKRLPINPTTMDGEMVVELMAEQDKNVRKLLIICVQVNPRLISLLDSMNMRGIQIWLAFYWYADGIFAKFRECVEKQDPEMINFVNRYPSYHRAVTKGGSPR